MLVDAVHNTNYGTNFGSPRDQALTCWFEYPAPDLQLDDVQPEVGCYAVRPIRVATGRSMLAGEFQAPPGWHDIGDALLSFTVKKC